MNWTFSVPDIAASFAEELLILLAVTAAAGSRFNGRRQKLILGLQAAALCALTIVLNTFLPVSWPGPVIVLPVLIFGASKLASSGPLLTRATVGVLSFLVVQTIDCILAVTIGYCFGNPEDVFTLLSYPGPIRITLIFFSKLFDFALYRLVRDKLSLLRDYAESLQIGLLLMSITACAFTRYLISVLISPQMGNITLAVILTWSFELIFVAVVLYLLGAMSRSEKDRQVHAHLRATSKLMAKNYQAMQTDKVEYAGRLHDFNRHLAAVRSLARAGKNQEIETYLDSLLSTSYREIAMCHSGSDIVDAIINCKAAEAREAGIPFSWKVEFSHLAIDPADVCAILANQIDNALDACRSRKGDGKPFVDVNIWQKTSSMVFFQVTNPVASNPFGASGDLLTSKESPGEHGLGIRNIRETAEKYSGSLQNTYQDGLFISTVFLCYGREQGDQTVLPKTDR